MVLLADARPAVVLQPTSYAVVPADARPAALFVLCPASSVVVLTDVRPPRVGALLAPAPPFGAVLPDARCATLLSHASYVVVFAD